MTYYIKDEHGMYVPIAYNPVYEVSVTVRDIADLNTALIGVNCAVDNNDRPAFDREISKIAAIGLRINTQLRSPDDVFEQLRKWRQTLPDQAG